MLLVIGDLNARLGKTNREDTGWYFHDKTNRNGELLRDTLMEGNLEASNHRFRKKPGKLWSFLILSDGTLTKSQIDYILIRKKWRNSLKNTEPYNFFSSIGSDHRVVVCNIQLSLRKTKTPPRVERFDYTQLKNDPELQHRYSVEVHNRFSCLTMDTGTESATDSYNKFIDAVQHTNRTLLPKKSRRKWDDPASDPIIIASRNLLNNAKAQYHLDPSENHRTEVSERKDELTDNYHQIEEEILRKKIHLVETNTWHNNNKESWNLVNEITGRKNSSCCLIDGVGPQERLGNWQSHFSNLLGQPPQVEDEDITINNIHGPQNIDTNPFTREELRLAKKQLTEGKAPGDDGVAPEVIKRVDLDDIILDFCNKALTGGDIAEQWKHMNIIPVPKKGDLTKADNYRGVALTSIISKTLNRMLLNRIKPSLESILRINQNGFRPGRSTAAHILALRRIIEGAKAKNLPAVLTFIDFKKAFDSIHRGILMKILKAYGIPDVIVNLIERMYTDTMAKVITTDGMTEAFKILAGVMQGDTLAPYLFIVVIDYIMFSVTDNKDYGFTIAQRRSRRYPPVKITDADFADDLALLSDSIKEAQEILSSLEKAASTVGLFMNESKTKYMSMNISSKEEETPLMSLSGIAIDKVDDFVYLGSWVANTERDFKVRKAKAWVSCHRMKNIWKSNLPTELKKRLFIATVESILLYGSETWTVTKEISKKIDGCYSRMLRMALNIDWKAHITNKEVYGNLPRVTTKIQERRMRLAGHLTRHDDLVAHKLVLWEPNHGKRSPGRPRITFVDVLRKDTGLDSTTELKALMDDRVLWRRSIDIRTKYPP